MGYDTVHTFLPDFRIAGSYSDLSLGSDCDLVTYSAKGEKTIVALAVLGQDLAGMLRLAGRSVREIKSVLRSLGSLIAWKRFVSLVDQG